MRLAAQEKMGFYPTPKRSLQLIAQLLIPASKGQEIKALDPCAGEGEALAYAADRLRGQGAEVTTRGVELSPERAEKAAQVLDAVLDTDWNNATVSNKAFSLLWLNPPYDWDHEARERHSRQEYVFLRRSYTKLQAGGLLVYIVPRKILAMPNAAKFLAAHFSDISVFRFPDGEYERFHQVAVFGRRRPRPLADEKMEKKILSFGSETLPPSLEEADVSYAVPPSADVPRFFFRKITLGYEEILRETARQGVHTTKPWKDFETRRLRSAEMQFRPAVPLRRGHLAELLASGLMGTMRLDGGKLLAMGRAIKVKETEEKEGRHGEKVTVEQERFVTRVYTLRRNGKGYEREVIDSADSLEEFLLKHGAEMGKLVEARHRPLLEKPTEAEWQSLDGLIPHKRLPGRSRAGLLDTQRMVAIGAARAIKKYGSAVIVAEMGFGKTAASLAVAKSLNAFPAVVLCPPHLVEKWKKEVQDVLPDAKAVILESISDVENLTKTYRPGEKVVAILGREKAKLYPGWRHAVSTRLYRTETGPVRVLACPHCGETIVDRDGIPIPAEPFLNGEADLGRRVLKCSACGEPLMQYEGKRWPLARYIRDRHKGFFKVVIADEIHQYKGKSTDQGNALQLLIEATKYALGLTGTFFGGKSTSIFWLLYRMNKTVRDEFGFSDEKRWAELYGRLETTVKESQESGTLSGRTRRSVRVREVPGISPQIVRLILPNVIFARVADLGYDLPPYEEEIVRLRMTPEQQEDYDELDSILQNLVKDAIQTGDFGLTSVWLQTMLSRPNAAFREERVWRTVPTPNGRKRVRVPVSVIRQNPETGEWEPVQLAAPPVFSEGELSPKEEWLVSFVKAEKARGRKVLVYVRQTGTRDIQRHLAELLESAGVRTVVLPDSVTPRKRERWIEQHVPELDALITNPRKVETGLDLVMFPSAVFYELDYSLYTLWQAQRRVWRLGQTRPVKVVYTVYQDTLEEQALALMAQKLRAAMRLYGEDATSAIAAEAEDGESFIAELAKKVLAKDRSLSLDGVSGLLKPDSRTTESPMGSPTQVSRKIDSVKAALDAWAQRHGFENIEEARKAARRRSSRRRRQSPPSLQQAMLFPA